MMHYVAMGVALLIAILTTTEIMWQNVNERKSQLAVLKATGWRDGMIRQLVLLEGVMTGLFAGLIGLAVSLGLIYKMYNQFPIAELGFLSLTLLIPITTGIIGALLPAYRAVKITPNAAIGSVAVNAKATERRFKVALGTVGTALVAGVAGLFFFATTSEVEQPAAEPTTQSTETTTGTKLADLTAKKSTASQPSKRETAKIEKLMNQGLLKTYPGDPKLKDATFRVGKLLDRPPAELKLTQQAGKRYITLPLFLHDPDITEDVLGSYSQYKPDRFTLQDGNGHVYETVDYVNRNEKAWKNSYQYFAPYQSRVDLVYEVPETENVFVMFASSDAFAKPTTVKIELN